MRKWLFALWVVSLFCMSVAPASVHAQGAITQQKDEGKASSESSESSGSSGIIGKQMDSYYSNEDNQPGLLERNVSDVLIGTANFLIQSFGMKDVTLLVFNKNPNPTSDGFLQGDGVQDHLYLGVFNEGMMRAVDALYSAFEHFMPYPVVMIVIVLSFLSLWNSTRAETRSQWKDYVSAFFIAILSIRFGYYIWQFVADIVETFTNVVWSTLVDHGVQMDKFLNMIWGNGAEGYGDMIKYRGFVVGILVLLAAIMTAILNYQYTMRTIILMILVSSFVVSAVLTIFPKYRHSLQTWWDLFWSHMIMPCAHALALGLFFLLLRYSSDGVSNWIIVAYLFGFSGIYALLNKVMGGQEQQRGGLGSMFGVGSMMALGRMFRSKDAGKKMKGGKETGQGQQNGSGGEGSLSESEGGFAASNGTGAPTMAAPTWQRRAAQSGGKVAGFALNYGAKAAGTVAGTSIGLMAGNPLVGAALGAKVGGWAGKGTEMLAKGGIQVSKAAVQGIQHWQEQRKAADTISSIPQVEKDRSTSDESAQLSGTASGHHVMQPTQGNVHPFRSDQPQSSSSSLGAVPSGATPFVTIPTLSKESVTASEHVPVTPINNKPKSESGHHALPSALPHSGTEDRANGTASPRFLKPAPVIFSPRQSKGHIPVGNQESDIRSDANAAIPPFLKQRERPPAPAPSKRSNSATQEPVRPIPVITNRAEVEQPPTRLGSRHYNYDL
ncbi:hypothetical protein [Paenibacillus sp. WLX2291]|uniref:hypothetical protein n=1 Tax=Paenibacillus sp. WLX2291 TaxID=3296934 RepID=UPI0039842014